MFILCIKETDNSRYRSISGGYSLPTNALVLSSSSYTDAKDWDGLMRALAESLNWSPPDEMILLLRDTASGPPEGLSEHVRPVIYHSLYRVPKQLLSNAPNVMRTIITRALQQPPRVGPTTGVKPDHDRQEQWTLVNTPQEKVADDKGEEAEAFDGDHEQEVDEIQDDAADAMQEVDRHRLEQERAVAARKIQVIYRRYLKRKNVVRKGIDETQAHFWHLLRERSTEMKWSKGSQYYLLFRVPLADILVCLDVIGAFFESKKKDASKRMKEAHNKELDELMEARSEYRYGNIDFMSLNANGLTGSPVNSSGKQLRYRRNSPHPQSSMRNGL